MNGHRVARLNRLAMVKTRLVRYSTHPLAGVDPPFEEFFDFRMWWYEPDRAVDSAMRRATIRA
jgi:hypothetical protein